MKIKQISIDEALELHKRGLMVGILQPVVPEPKNLDDYEFLTLKKLLEGCEFFRIAPEVEPAEEPDQAPIGAEEKPAEAVAEVEKEESEPETQTPQKSNQNAKKQIDFGKMKALRNAGWSIKQIAEELHLAQSTVCTYLKKMEGRKCED